MKKMILLFTCLLLLITACQSKTNSKEEKKETKSKKTTQTFGYQHGLLSVKNQSLIDENGDIVQLKGISLHNINQENQYVNRNTFKTLYQDWGVNTIRIPIYTEGKKGYCNVSEKEKDKIEETLLDSVLYAKELGIYVIIDWHMSSDKNPNDHLEQAKQFFQETSKKYHTYNNVIYEICSEPGDDTSWQDIADYANDVTALIRENCDNLVIIGTPNHCQDFDIIPSYPIYHENVIYAMHFDASLHKTNLQNRFELAIQNNIPIFVSEFILTNEEKIDEENAKIWFDLLDQYQISYVAWHLSNKKDPSALLQSSSFASWSNSELSDSGHWIKNRYTKKEDQNLDLALQIDVKDSWKQEDKIFTKLYCNLTNNSEDKEKWSFSITFDQKVEVIENWNCDVKVKNNTVTISNVFYNSSIKKGQSIDDIGIILSSDKNIIISKEVINK